VAYAALHESKLHKENGRRGQQLPGRLATYGLILREAVRAFSVTVSLERGRRGRLGLTGRDLSGAPAEMMHDIASWRVEVEGAAAYAQTESCHDNGNMARR
jgi:hypothetical protein